MIEHLVFLDGLNLRFLDEIIPDFDNHIVEINVSSNKVVNIRFESTDNSNVFYLHGENHFFHIKIKERDKLVSSSFLVLYTC